MRKIIKIIILVVVFSGIAFNVEAAQLGESRVFNVDPSYDLEEREQITAVLRSASSQLYFYVDEKWWNEISEDKRAEVSNSLNNLSNEFRERIYPKLTPVFGSEWKPGIDATDIITVLIHPMNKTAGGYFNSGDEYSKLENPDSNEREMVYLNSRHIDTKDGKSFFAHELAHLITFNQKDKIRGISEEVWLNEARAEYASTLVGYDNDYIGSNLQSRVNNFLNEPHDSLIEWKNKPADYGIINVFIQYLAEHYGEKILGDSLKSPEKGINSLNKALVDNGFKEDFYSIFNDWAIAVLLNDCQINEKYCYSNPNLKNFKITPSYNFLPMTGKSALSVVSTTKDWAGDWYKFVGGNGNTLELKFENISDVNFKIPYIVENSKGELAVSFFEVKKGEKSAIEIKNFGKENTSLTIIPLAQSNASDFSELGQSYAFSWVASTKEEPKQEEELIKKLLVQISQLQLEIAKIQAKINSILAGRNNNKQNVAGEWDCKIIENNLYYGIKNNQEVSCLQKFLKNQGSEIYPEAVVSGNFLSLTEKAVIRFQEKYADEILVPFGLNKGTGYVGPSTRDKINRIMNNE